MNDSGPAGSRVREALYELRNEHKLIMEQVRALLAVSEAGAAADVLSRLERLRETLHEHFAREESPEGLYERMGVRAEEHADTLRTLAAEHRDLLSALDTMLERARLGQHDSLVAEAHALAERLREHETKEHALGARLVD